MSADRKILRAGAWVLILAVSLSVIGLIRFNDIKTNQVEMKRQIDFRFKSYDFVYFAKYHKVIPDDGHTSGSICVDVSHKKDFYVGTRNPTPFFTFMDELSCDLKTP